MIAKILNVALKDLIDSKNNDAYIIAIRTIFV